jgi:hypothetical protein
MDTITTTIERRWFRGIVAKRKRVEYREIKAYWTRKLAGVRRPFFLRLINGMTPKAPEAIVVVTRVRKNSARKRYELHLGTVRRVLNWDRGREEPPR